MYIMQIESMERRGYTKLIDLGCTYCDEICVVMRSDLPKDENTKVVLNKLSSSLKEVRQQSEWPGTTLLESGTGMVHYYYIDDNIKEVLKSEGDSLFDWRHPLLPEDLCFLRSGKEWIVNTAHEGDALIITQKLCEFDAVKNIEGLKIGIMYTIDDKGMYQKI